MDRRIYDYRQPIYIQCDSMAVIYTTPYDPAVQHYIDASIDHINDAPSSSNQ